MRSRADRPRRTLRANRERARSTSRVPFFSFGSFDDRHRFTGSGTRCRFSELIRRFRGRSVRRLLGRRRRSFLVAAIIEFARPRSIPTAERSSTPRGRRRSGSNPGENLDGRRDCVAFRRRVGGLLGSAFGFNRSADGRRDLDRRPGVGTPSALLRCRPRPYDRGRPVAPWWRRTSPGVNEDLIGRDFPFCRSRSPRLAGRSSDKSTIATRRTIRPVENAPASNRIRNAFQNNSRNAFR